MAALVPGVIYVFNHQSMSNEYANKSIAELLGYSPEEIKGMGEDLFPTIIHPDDFDVLAEHVGSLQELSDDRTRSRTVLRCFLMHSAARSGSRPEIAA